MTNVIPFPLTNIDMQLSEIRSIAEILISVSENSEDNEFLRLRPSSVTLLYLIAEKCASADKSLPAIYRSHGA